MLSKVKDAFSVLTQELLGNGIGFGAGLWSYELVSQFFIEKSIWNLWGVFSSKTAVDSDTFTVLQVIAAGLIGFVVLRLTNISARILFRGLGLLKKPEEPATGKK